MVKFHIDLWVEVCPWRVVFENQQLAIGNLAIGQTKPV
jgi:hypothetical protein